MTIIYYISPLPNSPTEKYNRHCIQIKNFKFSYPDVTFLIVGDLNMSDVKRSNGGILYYSNWYFF